MPNAKPKSSLRQGLLAHLLGQYLAGRIAESQWRLMMAVLDESDISGPEREALGAYVVNTFEEFATDAPRHYAYAMAAPSAQRGHPGRLRQPLGRH
jgi:hypothetical protein